MSFGGAVSAMITSIKNNKRERKSKFNNRSSNTTFTTYKPFVDHKRPSPKQLEKLRTEIRLNAKNYKKRVLIYFIFSLIILILFSVAIVFSV